MLHVGAVLCLGLLFAIPARGSSGADVDAILRRIFPEAAGIEEKILWLDESGKSLVRTAGRQPFDRDRIPYRLVTGKAGPIGYAFVDDVLGLHEMITYLTVLDAGGAVRAIEILAYREAYGHEIKSERFRRQFIGRTLKDRIEVGSDIRNIAGATLSTHAISSGVRRILACYEAGLKSSDRSATPEPKSPDTGINDLRISETETGLMPVRRTRVLWGTRLTMEIRARDTEAAEQAIDAAYAEVDRLTPVFSRYDTSSELSRLNAGAGGPPVVVSEELYDLAEQAKEMSRATGFFFDPTKNRRMDGVRLSAGRRQTMKLDTGVTLDLDGIAKGYAVDRIVSIFKRRGAGRALINFGESSLAAMGAPAGKAGWLISVRDARRPHEVKDTPLVTLILKDAVLSSSGSYERGPHILNPFTGRIPPDSLQTVIVGPLHSRAAAGSDALSTALFAGERGALRHVESSGFEGLWLGKSDLVRTAHFSRYEVSP